MRVIRADVMGMCFGVRDALAVIDRIGNPGSVTIQGQLVHNQVVLDDLKLARVRHANRGRSLAAAGSGRGTTYRTDHGARNQRPEAEAVAECRDASHRHHVPSGPPRSPGRVVARSRRLSRALDRPRGHVEVQGVIEDLSHVDVVESESEVRRYDHPKLGIVCQTTATERNVAAIRTEIARKNPGAEIRFIDTVCLPTKEHQHALDRLLEQVDAVVVVGGWNSNNTRELVERCQEQGRRALHVQVAAISILAGFAGLPSWVSRPARPRSIGPSTKSTGP